jgi:hypothetical protein
MITVRALVPFHTGPRAANGSREIAIHKGATRQAPDSAASGAPFWTVTRWGTRFDQLCRVGHGWEVVRRPATTAHRAPQPTSTTPRAKHPAPAPTTAQAETEHHEGREQRRDLTTDALLIALGMRAAGIGPFAAEPTESAPESAAEDASGPESEGWEDWP